MKTSSKYRFNANGLKTIREAAGLTAAKVARETGIYPKSYYEYEKGATLPGLNAVIVMADYFRVPVDFLLCRTEDASDPKLYGDYFQKIRRFEYEAYVEKEKKEDIIRQGKQGFKKPYPYNLLCAAGIEDPGILTKDRDRGIEKAVDMLDGNVREAVLARYKDGFTIKKAAKMLGTKESTVKSRIKTGLFMLSSGDLRFFMEEGYGKGSVRLAKIRNEIMEPGLDNEICRYEEKAARLERLKERCKRINDEILEYEMTYIGKPISTLGLSVRAYNCLMRSGMTSIRDVVEKAETDGLLSVKGMGVGIANEIREKMARTYGIRLEVEEA